jgi:hypothetical protein
MSELQNAEMLNRWMPCAMLNVAGPLSMPAALDALHSTFGFLE